MYEVVKVVVVVEVALTAHYQHLFVQTKPPKETYAVPGTVTVDAVTVLVPVVTVVRTGIDLDGS